MDNNKPDEPAVNNRESVAAALTALGAAWRGDWSQFDGRTLRAQLDELASALTGNAAFDLDRWYLGTYICPKGLTWAENCDERASGMGYGTCDHLAALDRSRS